MKISFTDNNKAASSGSSYPKLSLDTGELARICILDAEPEMVYTHSLTMPVVKDGQIVMEERQKANGETYEVAMTDFVGAHMCTGDFEVVRDNEVDPENCITCKNVKQYPEYFNPPARRFAQHVLRYKTKPNSFDVQIPFSAELVAWVFTDNRFNALVDLVKEYGNPRELDLLLGPCKSKKFQNYEIKPGANCAWLQDDQRKAFVKELYDNNRSENLENLISKKVSASQAQIDIEKVKARFSLLNSGGSSDNYATESAWGEAGVSKSGDASASLAGLLGVNETTPQTASETPSETPSEAPAEVAEAPTQPTPSEAPEPKQKASAGTPSLSDLLEGL